MVHVYSENDGILLGLLDLIFHYHVPKETLNSLFLLFLKHSQTYYIRTNDTYASCAKTHCHRDHYLPKIDIGMFKFRKKRLI